MKISLIVAIVLFISSDGGIKIVDTKQTNDSQWLWRCKEGRCLRKPGLPEDLVEGSPESCKLVCGTYGALWPRPTALVNLSNKVLAFHPSSVTSYLTNPSDSTKDYIHGIVGIFNQNLLKECGGNCSVSSETNVKIVLTISSNDLTLNWATDEGYSLDLQTEDNHVEVKINAETVYGARHGLETLLQLTTSYTESSNPKSEPKNGLLILTGAKIRDRPAYPHRGLMLDTARNFIPVKAIKRTMDGMAASKLNVFHWHATDSQSFPIESRSVPQLARFGAYSADKVYHPEDIIDLLQYAKLRGIRIILEIDAPAHAGAGWQWGVEAGLGNLVACWNHQPWRERCIQPPCGQLNPANPHLYRFLGDLYRDITDIFPPGEAFHMGGDELFFPCWNSTKQITDLLESRGMGRDVSDFIRLWAEYQATALRIYDEAAGSNTSPRAPPKSSKTPAPIILWSSHLTNPTIIENYLQKDRYIIQTWVIKEDPLPSQLSELGYKVIMSTKDAWYLDHGFWGNTEYHTWREAYDNVLPRYKSILGGEACMWTEYVDENNLDTRVWPRAAAVGERLWSDPNSSSRAAESRFGRHRKRLVDRGINPEMLQPLWCYQNEGKCS